MTTLITGGTGFLGRHLIDQLIADGQSDLRVLSRHPQPELEDLGIDVFQGSLLSRPDLEEAAEGVDRVYHLAGRVERDRDKAHLMYELHVDGTRLLLDVLDESSTDIDQVVVASTSGTVGVGDKPDFMADDNSPHAESLVRNWPYYLSKIYGERVCFDYVENQGLPVVLMRPTLLLGPGDERESSIGDVVMFMKRQIPGIVDGGISFVDVRDTAQAFIRAMERGTPGETYLLGAKNLTMREFLERLQALSGIPAPKTKIPDLVTRLGSRLLDRVTDITGNIGDMDPVSLEMARHYWYIDSSKAKRELDWSPRDPDRTLLDTITWINEYHPDFQDDDGPRPDPPPELVPRETVEYARTLREKTGNSR